jgi:hypothetical protein
MSRWNSVVWCVYCNDLMCAFFQLKPQHPDAHGLQCTSSHEDVPDDLKPWGSRWTSVVWCVYGNDLMWAHFQPNLSILTLMVLHLLPCMYIWMSLGGPGDVKTLRVKMLPKWCIVSVSKIEWSIPFAKLLLHSLAVIKIIVVLPIGTVSNWNNNTTLYATKSC